MLSHDRSPATGELLAGPGVDSGARRPEFLLFSTPAIGEEEMLEVADTLKSGWITTGPKTQQFESAFREKVGASSALGLNSCTAGLHLGLLALGIRAGDEVITTPMTFCACANVIEHLGAIPVLVDVEPDTLNLSPAAVEAAITPRTKAVLAVHYAGHPVDLDAIESIAHANHAAVIEDAAHALPASYKGRLIGSGDNPVAFSFYATKNLTTGEGGMLTGPPEIIAAARTLGLHGMSRDAWKRYGQGGSWFYQVDTPGFKYNMTDVQAAMGVAQLRKLDRFQARRRAVVAAYNAAFEDVAALETPVERADVEHAWHLYVLRLRLGAWLPFKSTSPTAYRELISARLASRSTCSARSPAPMIRVRRPRGVANGTGPSWRARAMNGIPPAKNIALAQGRTIRGVRVAGTVDDLPTVSEKLRADFAIIALDPGEQSEMRRVVDQCIAAGLEFKTLPSLHELLEGTAGVNQLRNVRLEDLLGRPPVSLDLAPVAADLRGRVILLTGAAGSIGAELARQIAPFGPARLVLLDQSESDLYFVHLQLSEAHPQVDLVPVICDITNSGRLAQVYAQYHPDYVVHAAAYKHVPLMENNVLEAVRNNVLGTLLVATTAVRFGARKVLLVSTDKAIRPSSVMGATKRIAERIVFGLPNLHRSGTDFRAIRFGNVLASKGSVIPLFERQLAAGGPITVTHPLVERYFMTIPEAAQLVLQAGSLPETAGGIAMLEMGEPVRILDLAEKMIRFSGRVPGKDVCISFTGLRPGEKLTEDLVSALEATIPTSSPKIRISQTTEPAGPELVQLLSRLFAHLEGGDREGLLQALCALVPECVSPLSEHRGEAEPQPALADSRSSGAWRAVLSSSPAFWRERRRAEVRFMPPADLRMDERRQGSVCRRKDMRAGGRRRTDVELLLPAASSPVT